MSSGNKSHIEQQFEPQYLMHHVYLVRHGDVALSSDICYGQLDCAVASSFDVDLAKLVDYFQLKLVDKTKGSGESKGLKMISSPLTRCYQLASGLSKGLNKRGNLALNDDFKEIHFGRWEGLTWQSIGQNKIEEWNENPFDYQFPDGESARSFDRRVIAAWKQLNNALAELKQPQDIIIVCHAGVIRSIVSYFLHIPLEQSLSVTIDKMSVSCINVVPKCSSLSRCVGLNQPI